MSSAAKITPARYRPHMSSCGSEFRRRILPTLVDPIGEAMTARIAMCYCVDLSGVPIGRCRILDVRPCVHLLRHDHLRIERPLSRHCGDDGSWAPCHRHRWAGRSPARRGGCKRRQHVDSRPQATAVALAQLLGNLILRWRLASPGFHRYRKRHTLDRFDSGLGEVLARLEWQLR